jgi:hypothetical protein
MFRKSLAALIALSLSALGSTQSFARSAMYPMALPPQQAAPQRGYPNLGAPMYPCPLPNIPVQVGGTQVTNPAFAPHEMLYPHQYRAMYGPFFYRVKGSWIWTPFGIESHDKWELQGTEVKVNYKSRISPFSGFIAPR